MTSGGQFEDSAEVIYSISDKVYDFRDNRMQQAGTGERSSSRAER